MRCVGMKKLKLRYICDDCDDGNSCNPGPADSDVHSSVSDDASCFVPMDVFKEEMNRLLSVIGELRSDIAVLKDSNLDLVRCMTQPGSSNMSIGQVNKLQTVSTVSGAPSFAQVVSRESSVLVRPKNGSQSGAVTRADLLRCVNPVKAGVQVSGVRNISGGGVIVSCSSKNGADSFKSLAGESLAEKYNVKEVAKLHPRIRIVGLSEEFLEEELLKLLKLQNAAIFNNANVKLIASRHLKHNNNMYQAILQLDKETYAMALDAGQLVVGYDRCTVYDAIEVTRCFKCCGFHHISRYCKGKEVCSKCAGDHPSKSCTSLALCCINCLSASKVKADISTDHAAWSNECTVYKQRLCSVRADLLKSG